MNDKRISAAEFDRRFEEGEDLSEFLDPSSDRRPNLETKRVNVDFPLWMVRALDRHASRLGVTRQSVIKMWLADRLKRERRDPPGTGDG